jgi:hypothetical protein
MWWGSRRITLCCLGLVLCVACLYFDVQKIKRLQSVDAVWEVCMILCLVASVVYLSCQILILSWNTVDAAPRPCAIC